MRRGYAGLAAAAAVLAVLAAGAAGYAAGGDTRPAGVSVPAEGSAEAGFARDMAVHHQQAVEMSYIVRDRTKDTEVRRLAYDIAQTQANQRGMMLGWLDLWGLPKVSSAPPMAWMGMGDMPPGRDGALMPGMATNSQLRKLGSLSGKRAEVFYLQLMTAHHRGGIHMAEGCVAECRPGPERRLAEGMVDAQRSEIRSMADMLNKRGAHASS